MTTEITTIQTGDEVTIYPRHFPGDLDTEAGAQPWTATFLGLTTDGRIIIQTGEGKYGSVQARIMDPDALDQTTARQSW